MSQQNKTTLQAAINTQLADNTSGDISAADIRDNLINMTDSLLFNESTSQTITGALIATSFTGSLQGTATTASYVQTAQTASYVQTAQTASYVQTAQTASYVQTAQTASYVLNAVSASYATTASYILPTSPSSILVAIDGVGTDFTPAASSNLKSYLIPANTLTTSSILEVNVGIIKDTGNGNANMYLSLSSSVATTTIAYAVINSSQTYSPLWRNFAISGSQMISLNPNSSAATDAVASTLTIVSSSIDITVDNYIQVTALTLGSSAVARISYCKIIAHK
jgi:hypothetical protein